MKVKKFSKKHYQKISKIRVYSNDKTSQWSTAWLTRLNCSPSSQQSLSSLPTSFSSTEFITIELMTYNVFYLFNVSLLH